MGVSKSYVCGLDFLRLGVKLFTFGGWYFLRFGVSNSYVWGLDFSRLGVSNFYAWELIIVTFWG